MPFNGSGTYNLPAGNPVVTGTTISSTTQNNTLNDIATALTDCITRDGQSPATSNIPFGANKLTGVGNGTVSTDATNLGQVQAQAFAWCSTAGGTGNALTLSPNPSIAAYAAGQTFRFQASSNPNSGATTVAISGLSTIAVQVNGVACVGAEIAANMFYQITLDTTSTCQLAALGRPALADLATNATNLTGSGTISGTTTGGAGLTPTNATNATTAATVSTTVASGAVGTTQSIGDNSTKIATTAYADRRPVLGTAQATTSGTSITFSSIPSWVKRITINLKGVGTSSTSNKLVQIGSGSVTNTGYLSESAYIAGSSAAAVYTSGYGIYSAVAAARLNGSLVLSLESSANNTWALFGVLGDSSGTLLFICSGQVSLGGALDRVVLTTVNGSDTFAAGEVNIMYE